jgi:hypothetical protein
VRRSTLAEKLHRSGRPGRAAAILDRRWPAALAFSVLLVAAAPPMTFEPAVAPEAGAAAEYRRLWDAEGRRIAAALEAETGLTFPAAPIDVIVEETRPMTAYDGRTIWIRGSYAPDYKKGALVHELGHRLALTLRNHGGLDDHRLLYLFLYDVWTDLYGQPFADWMVGIERRIGPNYDAAWTWALAMTREERRERLAALRASPG